MPTPRRRSRTQEQPIHGSGRRVAGAVAAIACLALAGCHRGPARTQPATPGKGFVRIEPLAPEHPFYPELARLDAAAEWIESGKLSVGLTSAVPGTLGGGAPPPRGPRQPEAAPADTGASHETGAAAATIEPPPLGDLPPAARAALAEVDAEVQRQASRTEAVGAETAAEANAPSPPGLKAAEARADEGARKAHAAEEKQRAEAAQALRNKRTQLYQIILSETATACREIALEKGLDVSVGSESPPGAADVTDQFRPWLREHWRVPEQGLPPRDRGRRPKT
jgi:Skp family chaperone for outer membrane proteins